MEYLLRGVLKGLMMMIPCKQARTHHTLGMRNINNTPLAFSSRTTLLSPSHRVVQGLMKRTEYNYTACFLSRITLLFPSLLSSPFSFRSQPWCQGRDDSSAQARNARNTAVTPHVFSHALLPSFLLTVSLRAWMTARWPASSVDRRLATSAAIGGRSETGGMTLTPAEGAAGTTASDWPTAGGIVGYNIQDIRDKL